MSMRKVFQNLAPKYNSIRNISTNSIRQSAEHHDGAGIPLSTLPFKAHNIYKTTVGYAAFLTSGLLFAYLAFAYSVHKQASG